MPSDDGNRFNLSLRKRATGGVTIPSAGVTTKTDKGKPVTELDKLDERIRTVENRLGIPSPSKRIAVQPGDDDFVPE